MRRWYREANVIQLYNIHGGYFSFTALPLISRHRPVVWRLSDMWALTGHTTYSYECERWRTGCGDCPHWAEDVDPLHRDTTALLWRIKRWVYRHANLHIVAPSTWLGQLARESPLLGHFPISVIPNGLDTSRYRPIAKPIARDLLGLNQEMPTILFAADNLGQKRKGGIYLQRALKILADMGIKQACLLLMGDAGDHPDAPEPFSVRSLGWINDDLHMALAYSAADLLVLPSLADNLPNTMLEAMACGTPVVAFSVGGIPDAVRHMETGYLASYKDAEDLARGMKLLLDDPSLCKNLGHNARMLIEQEHTEELQAQRFLELYEEALAQRRASQKAA